MAPESASTSLHPTATPRTQQWQLPVFLLGVTAAIAAWTVFPPQRADPAARYLKALTELKKHLEQRPPDLIALDDAVRRIAPQLERFPDETHRVRFLLGSARIAAAEYGTPSRAAENWAEANRYFAACDPLKLADKTDAPRCVFRAAKAAAAMGTGDPKLLIPALATLPPGEDPGEAKRLLAETCLRINPPDLKRARDELAAYIGGNHRATPATVARHKLKLGELCLGLNDPDAAKRWLEQIGPTVPPDVIAVAKVQLARLAASQNRTADAVKLLEEAQKTPGLPADQRGLVLYETGRGLQALKNMTEARKYYKQARTADGPAGIAASVRLAALAVRDPEPGPNPLHPADLLEGAVRNVKSAGDFLNPHVGVEELRATFEEVIQAGLSKGDYELAVRTVAAYSTVAPPGRARVRQAEATAAWAAKLAAQNDGKAEEKFKLAAADFTTAAVEATDPRQKAELFRQAGDCLTRGGDRSGALEVYDRWTAAGLSVENTAPAHLAKADLLLSAGRYSEGLDSLNAAAVAGGVSAMKAKFRQARAELDEANRRMRGNVAPTGRREAEQLAEHGRELLAGLANLSGEEPAEREVRQQALLELGKSLYSRKLPEAEVRLRQLMQTNPTGRTADGGRLYLGTVLLMLARGDDDGGRPPADAEKKLAEAIALFEELSKSNEPFYRTHGDIRLVNALLQLRRYDDLATVTETLAKRYKDRPEELIVLSMLYTGYRRAERPTLADRVLARMVDVYTRIPASAYPGGMEEMTQAYWKAWMDKSRPR